jgi:O-antigen/teichoic acid export membrane protein
MKNISNIKKIVQGIGVYTLLSLVASFCNFLFNFTLIRLLSEQEFRDLTLANNMINVFGNLFVALNIVSIAVFYMSKDKQADIIRACQKIIYVLYVLLLAACVIFSGQVQQRTGLHDALILNLTLAVIFCSIPVMVLNAIYLGSNRFNRSAIMNVSLALGRLLLGVAGAIALATHKDAAAVGGILLVFVIVFGLFILTEKGKARKQSLEVFKRIWDAPVHVLKQYRLLVASSVAYAITINFLFGLDLFMFGQFFSNSQSADYAAVSIIGKLIFFFVFPISIYLAAKQQELIHSKPGLALKASLGVNALVLCGAGILALIPSTVVSLLIHRPAGDINHTYLLLSLLFNSAVVLTNHQLIEAIVGKRQKLVLVVTALLMAINGSLFLWFNVIQKHLTGHSHEQLALGIPALTMLLAALVLFAATHLFRKRRTA